MWILQYLFLIYIYSNVYNEINGKMNIVKKKKNKKKIESYT